MWDKLEEIKSDLHLVHPLKTKAIASNKLKNDKLDAKMWAKLLRGDGKIAKRRGDNKAVVAVARKLVKIIYAVLSSRNPSLYGDKIKTEKKIKRMKKIAERTT